MYKITKLVNNNIVCANDGSADEVILRGLGIGFKKKIGETVAQDKIEKIYALRDNRLSSRFAELLEDIPEECINVCGEIIEMVKESVPTHINKNLYITLTDHVNFAIKRKHTGLEYKNAMLTEIKQFYPEEFALGLKALDIIKKKLGEDLSVDEAGFIALHIVNAQIDAGMGNMMNITEIITSVLGIVERYYKITLDKESLAYQRFITHMKFFGQRLFCNKIMPDDDKEFNKMFRKRYAVDYGCAVKIRGYIAAKYNKVVSDEEMTFLTIHLKRIVKNTG